MVRGCSPGLWWPLSVFSSKVRTRMGGNPGGNSFEVSKGRTLGVKRQGWFDRSIEKMKSLIFSDRSVLVIVFKKVKFHQRKMFIPSRLFKSAELIKVSIKTRKRHSGHFPTLQSLVNWTKPTDPGGRSVRSEQLILRPDNSLVSRVLFQDWFMECKMRRGPFLRFDNNGVLLESKAEPGSAGRCLGLT